MFGLSSVAQVVLGKGSSGQYLSINLAFGIGATLGIYAAGGVSGEQHCQRGTYPRPKKAMCTGAGGVGCGGVSYGMGSALT